MPQIKRLSYTKVIIAKFIRLELPDRIRIYYCIRLLCGSDHGGMNQKALGKIMENVPVGRLVKSEEVASLIAEVYHNETLAGDVFHILGGLRLGLRG